MVLTPSDLASRDVWYWADLNKIKLVGGLFTPKGHEFQLEPMGYRGRRICYMKAGQSFGATTLEGLRDVWGMINRKYLNGVAHIFPSMDEVSDFSKFFFKPLIANNRKAIGAYVSDTDTAFLKKVNDSFLYLRGGRLSQKIGDTDEDTSSKTAGFTVDRVVFDEIDFMDDAVIEKYKARMYHSPIKEEVYLGNPSHEDHGIDLIFKQSDQRHWFRKCSCGEWTCAEKSFLNDPNRCVRLRSDGSGYIGCNKCGKEVLIWSGDGTGEWVADHPKNSAYMHGYHLSRLTNIFTDPAEVLNDFLNPPNNDLTDVYRLQLGRAYSSESDKLRKSDVLACCGRDIMSDRHPGPCAIGIDNDAIKHVVIGVKIDNERYEIVKVAKCKDEKEVHDLCKRFNVKSAVIDRLPNIDTSTQFQKEEKFKVWMSIYSDTQAQDAIWNDNTGIVKVNRTGIFDATHRLIKEGKLILPRQSSNMEEFAVQCCNCARFEEKNKRTKQMVFRYRDTGDRKIGAHYRNALNYFLMAASDWKIGTVKSNKTRQTVAMNDYIRV